MKLKQTLFFRMWLAVVWGLMIWAIATSVYDDRRHPPELWELSQW